MDLRLNCAAEICCDQPEANVALASLLEQLGVPQSAVGDVVRRMRESGVVLMPAAMAKVIRALTYGADRKKKT